MIWWGSDETQEVNQLISQDKVTIYNDLPELSFFEKKNYFGVVKFSFQIVNPNKLYS
jgi:hypothetical protein